MEYCDPVFGTMDVEGRRRLPNLFVKGWGSIRLTVKFFPARMGCGIHVIIPDEIQNHRPKRVSTPGYGTGDRFMRAGWK